MQELENMTEFMYYPAALGLSIVINYILYRTWKFDILKSAVRTDRWGSKVVPLTGGLAVFTSFFIICLLRWQVIWDSPKLAIALGGGILMFFLGLIDDIFELESYQKFLFQIIIVLLLIFLGLKASLFGKPWNYIITFTWMLGITNAFNLLDNMDGLAAGIASISLIFLGLSFYSEGLLLLTFMSLTYALVLLGFLVFNFNPARVYLGDSGALLTGYFLSVLTLLGSSSSGKSLFVSIIFPLLIMLIPILDTTLVSITRRMRGQSPFLGGKDHLSHRLVILGMTERQAVLFLYGVSILLGGSTIVFSTTSPLLSIFVYFLISLFILLFGVYMGKIKILQQQENSGGSAVISTNFLYKTRVLHILVDLFLFALIYYFSYLIRFEGLISKSSIRLFVESIPIILFFKIIFLYTFNVYKIESRYFAIKDALNLFRSITLGSVFTIITLTFLARFQGYSRAVFMIDWMLSLIVIGGVKVFYRIFDELFYSIQAKKKEKIILVGNRRTYQAVNAYLKLKSNLNLMVIRFFPLTDFVYDVMMKYMEKLNFPIAMILVEEKGMFSVEQTKRLEEKGIALVDEKAFFSKIL